MRISELDQRAVVASTALLNSNNNRDNFRERMEQQQAKTNLKLTETNTFTTSRLSSLERRLVLGAVSPFGISTMVHASHLLEEMLRR